MNVTSLLKNILPISIINLLKSSHFYKIYRERQLQNKKSISQAGQDYWVINEVFTRKREGYFLEIGSADGIYINNTYLLEQGYGWKGICIEANPNSFRQLKANRNCTCLNLCLDSQEGEVDFIFDALKGGILDQETDLGKRNIAPTKIHKLKTATLANVLRLYNAPKIIDYLSIDVEGAETRILGNFPFEDYNFLSITIERPSDILHNILINHGYLIVKVVPGLDNFYIHKSLEKIYRENQKKLYKNL